MDIEHFPPRSSYNNKVNCSVRGCQSKARKNLNVRFHIFPKPNKRFIHLFGNSEKIDRFKAWKNALKIEEVNPHMRVCSLHFKKEDYMQPSNAVLKKRHLKKTAVPSRNLPSSTREKTSSVAEADEARRIQKRIRRNCQRKELMEQRIQIERPVMQEETNNEEENPAVVSIHEIHVEDDPSFSALLFQNAEVQVNKFVNFIKNKNELSTLTGIESFEILNTITEIVELAVHKDKFENSKVRMNMIDRIIMTYIKLKQNASYSFLGIMFGCTAKHCQRVFYEMIKILSKCLKVAISWPSKEEIAKKLPPCFEDFKDVRVVVDCTEVFIQKPAKFCCQLSTYKTCKIMTGVTPAGNISYVSRPYGGRVSDTVIFEQSNLINLLQPDDAVMVDEEILIDKVCELNRFKCIRPSFLKDKQLTKAELILTCKIAAARVHVERSYQRIKAFKIVSSKMPTVPILGDIFVVICATINMSLSILQR
ncbi:uncharacterized protein LOC112464568 isoform X1 [Temnothorax curvispinosus]|uniref:Uncharacterized protein LOC112464568 isoform X1 n=2 Tax=Temnothorax curvispinosus TaxID=300111 RepID=A0A6J1QYI3_9HYME|nr:uncharacterized protein LOC112464568 isoform X1 [Temnothorax curvispinosus]